MTDMNTVTPIPATKKYYQDSLKTNGLWYDKSIKDADIPNDMLHVFGKEIIEKYQVIPVGFDAAGQLILVTDLSQNLKETPLFEELAGMSVKINLSDAENVREGILFHCNVRTKQNADGLSDIEEEETDEYDEVEKSALVSKVERIISTALNRGGSDIHLEPGDSRMYVSIRIDGRLVNFSREFPIDKNEKTLIVNIVKSMCKPPMNTSNKIMPDGGSFTRVFNQKLIDFRISTIPTIRGQKMVIRLLDSNKVPLDLDELGFLNEDIKSIQKALMMSAGLFIVTGPVGSGKSTTIHAAIKPFKSLNHNTITIENPCEYRDELLTQIQIRQAESKERSLDGKKIFKEILRQDPETIFYGETRDQEDAELLITASLSGHRVLTTLHAKDAVSALDRLLDMGINKSSLLKELNGILSQRLLALNCPNCVENYVPSGEEILLLSQQDLDHINNGTPKQGKGCPACNEGFLGRTVVAEIILFDNKFRDFLNKERGINEILFYLRKEKQFKTIWEKGIELVKAGKVTLSELIRVFPPSL